MIGSARVEKGETMRLIDADRFKAYMQEEYLCYDHTLADIDAQPTVDPIRHGHWEEENTRTHSMQFKCSECGRIAYYPQNHHSTEPKRCGYAYCPSCGARMEGEDETD